jgi:integrase
VHAGYWLPLMAAYYGGRLEELAGVEIADLVDTKIGLAFWIRPNSTRTIKGGEKASRCLPVHPILSELGFIGYLQAAREAGTKRLFPSLSRGATFGELFVEHCRDLLKPAQGRKVGMHCFRHSWETAKRAAEPNFDYSIGRYIAGRSIDQGSAALYGSAAGLPKIKSELAKIQYGLKHRPAPPVTAQMLREQEATSSRNLRAGIGRRKN